MDMYSTVFACAFLSHYACTAMLIDDGANYSCRLMSSSTLTEAVIHKGGSVNKFKLIAMGY